MSFKRLNLILLFLLLSLPLAPLADDVIWMYNDDGGIYTARPIPDLDDEGIDDVVFAGYYSDFGDVLYCVSGVDGSDIWTKDYDDCKGIWGVKPLAVAPDVDDDGYCEVVMGTPGGYDPPGRCVILKSGIDGETIWQWSCYQGGLGGGWVYSVAVMPDINYDGDNEILAACGGWSGSSGIAACLDGGVSGGDYIWIFRPDDAVMDIDYIEDITSDGIPEVVCISGGNYYDHTLYCIDGASTGTVTTPLWSYVLTNDGWSLCTAGDLDDDGVSDIFVACFTGYSSGSIHAVSGGDGSEIWAETFGFNLIEVAALPDVDGDGKMEAIFGSWTSNALCYSGADGTQLWSASVGSDCWNVQAIDDIDDDGYCDVVAGALNGKVVKFISGDSGTVLAESPIYNERIYDVEPIGDVDDDGIGDVVFCFQDQTSQPECLICYDGKPEFVGIFEQRVSLTATDEGMLISWEYSGSTSTVSFDIFRKEALTKNDLSSGGSSFSISTKVNDHPIVGNSPFSYLDAGVVEGKSYIWTVLVNRSSGTETLGRASGVYVAPSGQQFALAQNYPNPWSEKTTIGFNLPADGDITLELYDLGGRQVAVVAQGFYTAGNHTLILTGEELASGVYLLRLTAIGETLERTMALSR